MNDRFGRLLEFHRSFAEELKAKKNRVRNLIGSANWGEEGRYKEVLFANVLKQYVPDPYHVSTGFFIDSDGRVSKQIDIIIHDGRVPVYFKEGDFVILPEQAVIAFVEIKTRIGNNELGNIFERYATIYSGRTLESPVFLSDEELDEQNMQLHNNRGKIKFKGLFVYDLRGTGAPRRIREILATNDVAFDHIVLGQKYFIKYWYEANEYCIYELGNLSYTYFVSNLFSVLSELSGVSFQEQSAFRYPLPDGKERECIDRVKRND